MSEGISITLKYKFVSCSVFGIDPHHPLRICYGHFLVLVLCENHCAAQFPWLHIPESSGDFPHFCPGGAFFVFSSQGIESRLFRWSKVALLSSFAVVWYSSGHVEAVHSSASLVAAKVVLMSGDRRGNAASPQ